MEIPEYKKEEVIKLYLDKPFAEFNFENLRPIRSKTALGLGDIKSIILEYINKNNTK